MDQSTAKRETQFAADVSASRLVSSPNSLPLVLLLLVSNGLVFECDSGVNLERKVLINQGFIFLFEWKAFLHQNSPTL